MIRIITSLVAVLSVVSVQSQNTQQIPKLVVGITIDQLRGDYLEIFQHSFSEKGFKRLMNEGLVYQNMTFGYPNINSASAIATIYTGTTPFYHGIVSDKVYSSQKNTVIPVFGDDDYLGNYTQEKLSPKALKVSTITDELKIASKGFSDVYSFAPNSYEALITAGHVGDCAYWINDFTGKWSTSTYYKSIHWTVDSENRNGTYSTSLGSLSWRPLLPSTDYKAFPYTSNNNSFQHLFDSYLSLKKSPLTNEYIGETSSLFAEKSELGKRSYPDFLSLTFYLGNYPKSLDKNYSLEIQDAYVRMDSEMESLLKKLDKTIGLDNVLIFVTSTGYYNEDEIYPSEVKMLDGVFYTNRCEALLNMYLIAVYGKEQWVEKIYDNQIFLNRKLIESKKLNLAEFQNKVAEFVVQFAGVQDAVTTAQLLSGKSSDNLSGYKEIFNKDVSGDVFIEVQAGYKIVNELESNSPEKRVRETAIAAPVIFFGNSIVPQKIKRTIKATEIAPTVSRILRIRSPNGAKEQALPEFL